MPVWVTGHSLGGGYANALTLHLLAQRQGAQLFSAGVYPRKTLNPETTGYARAARWTILKALLYWQKLGSRCMPAAADSLLRSSIGSLLAADVSVRRTRWWEGLRAALPARHGSSCLALSIQKCHMI